MPYLGGRIFDAFGFGVNGAIYTAAGLTGLLLATRLPRVEPVTVRPSAAAIGAPASSDHTVAAPSSTARRTSLGGARALLARKEILIAAFSGSIIFFSWGISGAFYSIYVKEGLGFTATTVGILLTWQSAFNTIARLGFAQMAHRVRIDRVLLITGVANALPLMLLPWIRTLPMLMAVAAVTGLASGVVPISIKTLYANATNDQERSLAMGIDGVAMNIGSLASPVLAGAAAQAVGIPTTFFVGNLLTILALFASRRAIDRPTFVRSISGRDPEAAPTEDGFAAPASG
jgi:predicted MFS family arabinose efflux permease